MKLQFALLEETSQTRPPLTIIMDLKQSLKKLECHFTWDLGSTNELRDLLSNLNNMNQELCSWLVHYYNLLGYIQQTLGSNEDALMHLHKAESLIQEQGTEEAGVRLQVNKANLAWVYFHLGEMDKSKEYLEEVESLQRMHPAPPGCTLHPEVSGEKGWTLMKLDMSKKRQAVDCFKMALEAEPGRKEWQKGLALVMNMEFVQSEFTLDEIVEQLKIAHEKEPNGLFIHAHYLLKLCNQGKVTSENIKREMQGLLDRSLETETLEGFSIILRYYREEDSLDEAIQIAERAYEKFPSSVKAAKHLAVCYKWKVFQMKEGSERKTLARRAIGLLNMDVSRFPHTYKEKIALASLHCYTRNFEEADKIYKSLLSEKKNMSPHRQQHLFYSYAQHLNYNKQSSDSISYYKKAAKIPEMTVSKKKSIKVLESIVRRGRDPRCKDIYHFLNGINTSD